MAGEAEESEEVVTANSGNRDTRESSFGRKNRDFGAEGGEVRES